MRNTHTLIAIASTLFVAMSSNFSSAHGIDWQQSLKKGFASCKTTKVELIDRNAFLKRINDLLKKMVSEDKGLAYFDTILINDLNYEFELLIFYRVPKQKLDDMSIERLKCSNKSYK